MLDLDESVRLRSEGALDLARTAEPDLRRIAMGLNSERWRDYLPELEALGRSVPKLRAARDRLDTLREKERWPDDAAPTHALVALERALYALEGAVQLQLKGQSIDHGAPLLEDAIVQLTARARATAPPEGLRTEEFAYFRQMFGLTVVLSTATLFTVRWLVIGLPVPFCFSSGLLALSVFRLASQRCPRCSRRFLRSGLLKTLASMRCGHCGYRGAAP